MNQPTLWNYALGDLADVNDLNENAPEQGRVSLRHLFQEINAIPIANGGIAPKRKDINCLFKAIGEHIFYIQRGGQYSWRADVTYPKNAVITYNGIEYKAQDENTGLVPDLSPTAWKPLVEVTPEKLREELAKLPTYDQATSDKLGLVKISSEIDSNSDSVSASSNAVKQVNDKIEQIKSDVSSLSETVSNISSDLSSVTSDLSDTKSDVVSLTTRTKNLETSLAGIDTNASDISELKTRLNNAENSIEANGDLIAGHTTDITAIKTDIDTLKVAAGDTSAINNLESRISGIESSLGNAAESCGVYKFNGTKSYDFGSIVYYQGKIYVASKPNDSTETQVPAGVIPTVSGSEDYWKEVNTDGMRESLSNLGNLISELQTSKATVSSVEEVKQSVNSTSSQLSTLKNDVDSIAGIFEFDPEDTESEFNVGNIVEYQSKLYKCISDVAAGTLLTPDSDKDHWIAISSADSSKSGISEYNSSSIYNAGDVVYGSDNKIYKALKSSVNAPLTDTESWIELSKTEVDLTSVNSSISGLQGRVETLESAVENLESGGADVSTLATKTELNAVIDRVETVEEKAQTLTDKVQALESIDHTKYALKTDIPSPVDTSSLATKSSVDDLTDRVDDLESIDHTQYALKTDIPEPVDTSSLATKSSVEAIDTRVKALENAEKGSGIANFDNTKTYKAGDLVIYDNKIYQATDTSLNSVPSSTNTNWKEISESEASTLLAKINAVSDRVQTLENIDHSQYALKTDIPETQDLSAYAKTSEVEATYAKKTDIPDPVDTSTLATKSSVEAIDTRVQTLEEIDHTKYALKTEIPSTSNLATKSEVQAIDTRVQALEAGESGSESGSGTSSAGYQSYFSAGMFVNDYGDSTFEYNSEDLGQNDWNISYKATGPAFKSIKHGFNKITVDLDSKYDVRAMRLDIYGDFLALPGFIEITVDGKTPSWLDAKYYMTGTAELGAVYASGMGGTDVMIHWDAKNPYLLQYNNTSKGDGMTFYIYL